MSSLDRELEQIYARLANVEAKVDRLLDFRGWVLGAVAAISTGVSVVVAFASTWFAAR